VELSKPITFAVVGLGRIGYRHAEQIAKTEGFALSAVCDVSEELRAKASTDFSDTAVFSDFDELLMKGEFQVIVIATPSHFHHSMTLKALINGYHVLVEKPMAANADEAREMLAAARKAERFLTVHQSVRYQPDTTMVKEAIDAGRIGRVFQVYRGQHAFKERRDWQIWKKYGGGAIANLGVHFLDAAMLMVKSNPQTVFAKFDRILDQGDAEDCYKIVVRYDGGEIVESEFLRAYDGKAMWHVCGTKGSIYIDDTLPLITMQVKTIDGKEWSQEYDFRTDQGNMPIYYADFASKLLAGEDPPVTPESVITQLAVIDAARESDKTGLALKVKL